MMRHHMFAPDSYFHVCNRGVKKLPIYREQSDFWRLLFNLYYFNNTDPMPLHWKRELETGKGPAAFCWPEGWGTRKQLVSVLAQSLMPNHVHLLVKEKVEGGIAKFMHKTTMGYSKFINEKYDESGSLFQGSYRMRRITDDFDLRYVAVYVMVKNSFELYPGGLKKAIEHFDDAYEHAITSPFNSLAEYAGRRESPLIDKDLLGELFGTPEEFKKFARECMLYKLDQLNAISDELGL